MKNENFNEEDLLKTMLQVAKRSRELTDVERRIDTKLAEVSQSRTEHIINYFCKEGWISQHLVFPEEPVITTGSTIQQIYPFLSCDGEGLTADGEDKLKDLIKKYEEERKSKRKKCLLTCIKWIGGVLTPLLIAFLIWFFGWN